MKHVHKTIPAIVLVLLSSPLPKNAQDVAPRVDGIRLEVPPNNAMEPSAVMCRIRILVEQPGYAYTIPQIREMVLQSDAIARVIAVDTTRIDEHPRVRFQTTEVLRGPLTQTELTDEGYLVDEDGFNTLSVPYQLVRPAGGSCFATSYRQDAEYLFLLERRGNRLTPYWFPLGPTNEQIRGDDDPWLQWVREQLAEDPGLAGLPPLR